jgi:hypothetical protein
MRLPVARFKHGCGVGILAIQLQRAHYERGGSSPIVNNIYIIAGLYLMEIVEYREYPVLPSFMTRNHRTPDLARARPEVKPHGAGGANGYAHRAVSSKAGGSNRSINIDRRKNETDGNPYGRRYLFRESVDGGQSDGQWDIDRIGRRVPTLSWRMRTYKKDDRHGACYAYRDENDH